VDVLSSRILLRPSDLDRSRRFYRDLLGLAIYREFGPPEDPGLVFYLGQGLLEVSGHAAGPPGRSVMIWIQVRDVHAEHARLAAAGVPIVREPAAEPWGLIEMWIEDPDGIRIVLVEVPDGHPLRRDLRPVLPPGRSTGCRITAWPTETQQASARPECGRFGRSPHVAALHKYTVWSAGRGPGCCTADDAGASDNRAPT
jgi:catechol 2,3-dioxygenase-like lactoylglutathione lyase family enzyme